MPYTETSKHLRRFVIWTYVLTYAYSFGFIFAGGVKTVGLWGIIFMMWIPGAVSLVYRWITKMGFNDVGWKLGALKYHLVAIFLPLFLALFTGLAATLFSIREFGFLPQEAWHKAVGVFGFSLLAGAIGAFGEEVGWRGFLIPKIFETNIRFPFLLTGLIWGLWHIPMVTSDGYYQTDEPVLIAIIYTVSIICIGYFITWLRMVSGSVWVATVAHASHNFFLQNSNKSLLGKISKTIQAQIDTTTPNSKRRSEKIKLEQLLTQFSQDEIESALDFVKKYGALGTGEKVHSPFGYLSVAISDVLRKIKPETHTLCFLTEIRPKPSTEALNMEEALAQFEKELSKKEQKVYIDEFATELEEISDNRKFRQSTKRWL